MTDEGLQRQLADRWHPLGTVPPNALTPARVTMHWAAQVAASIGFSFVEPEEDYGHTALTFDEDTRTLLGRRASAGFRAGLAVADGALVLLGPDDGETARLPIEDRSLEDAYAFMAAAVAGVIGRPIGGRLVRPGHDLPDHDIGRGYGTFSAVAQADREELARWFGDAHVLLEAVRHREGSDEVRCWPHHFDVATLLTLDDAAGESARSIGIGMSPGDSSYDEPYFYVTPWPYPSAKTELPQLQGGGIWHTHGWTGAVLRGTTLADAVDTPAQLAQVTAFVNSALRACRSLL